MHSARMLSIALWLAPVCGIASGATHAQTPQSSDFPQTPAAAALATLYPPENRHVTVVRVNRAGRFATVLLDGAVMENQPFKDPILVEHFAFGWQSLENGNLRCILPTRGINRVESIALMRGMPASPPPKNCASEADVGPPAEVERIRRIQGPGGFHPFVAVVGDYALADWYGGGGGEHVYAARHGHWVRIGGGGGALDVDGFRALGVARKASCIFAAHGTPDKPCGNR